MQRCFHLRGTSCGYSLDGYDDFLVCDSLGCIANGCQYIFSFQVRILFQNLRDGHTGTKKFQKKLYGDTCTANDRFAP